MEPRAESRLKIGNACLKIWSRVNVLRWHVLRYGAESRKPNQCIKIGNACIKIWNRVFLAHFSALCDNFRYCEIFSKKIQKFLAGPARADNYYACGYLIARADTDITYCYVKRLCNSFKKLIRMYRIEQKHDISCTFT